LVGHIAFNSVPVLSTGLGVDLEASLPRTWQAWSLAALALSLLAFMMLVGRDRLSRMNRREEVTEGDNYVDEVQRA
jgi:hypothetical protein